MENFRISDANARFDGGLDAIKTIKRGIKRIKFRKNGVNERLFGPTDMNMGEKNKPISFGRNSKPINKTEENLNNFLEFHFTPILQTRVSQWKSIKSYMKANWSKAGKNFNLQEVGVGTTEGMDILIKDLMITPKTMEKQMMDILSTWKRGKPYILSYRESFKWDGTAIYIKYLKIWMLKVLKSKEFAATLIQSYIRRKLVYIKYKKEITKFCENIVCNLRFPSNPSTFCWDIQVDKHGNGCIMGDLKDSSDNDSWNGDLYN